MSLKIILIQLISIWVAIARGTGTCYYPNGTAVTDGSFQPCRNTQYSMCCATAQRPAYTTDTCLDNGLCLNPCDISTNECGSASGGTYWRESCSDPTWASPFCFNHCISPNTNSSAYATTGNDNANNVPMTQCPSDGKWCCGYISPLSCCSDSSRFAVNQTIGVLSSTSTVASSSTIAITSSTTAAAQTATTMAIATPSTTPQSAGSSTMSKETQVGIGVGIGVGVPILLAIALIPWCLRRRRNMEDAPKDPTGTRSANHSAFYGQTHEFDTRNSRMNGAIHEKFGYAQLSELNAQPVIYEMGTSR